MTRVIDYLISGALALVGLLLVGGPPIAVVMSGGPSEQEPFALGIAAVLCVAGVVLLKGAWELVRAARLPNAGLSERRLSPAIACTAYAYVNSAAMVTGFGVEEPTVALLYAIGNIAGIFGLPLLAWYLYPSRWRSWFHGIRVSCRLGLSSPVLPSPVPLSVA